MAEKPEALQAAYDEIKAEYARYREDTRKRIESAESAITVALTGTRTGNMLTPPWVIEPLEAYVREYIPLHMPAERPVSGVSLDDLALDEFDVPVAAECREAYPGALEYGEVIECMKGATPHRKHANASGSLKWWGARLSEEQQAEADRIRALGGIDVEQGREYAAALQRKDDQSKEAADADA